MKASESIGNYDIKVREYTNYAIKSIKNCCKNFGQDQLVAKQKRTLRNI